MKSKLKTGLIDVIPMIIMKLEKVANISAFIHYFVLGLIIPFIEWGINPLITGIMVSLISMIIFFIILGAGIGFAGNRFIG